MRKTPVYARPGEACEARGSPREACTYPPPPETPARRINCRRWGLRAGTALRAGVLPVGGGLTHARSEAKGIGSGGHVASGRAPAGRWHCQPGPCPAPLPSGPAGGPAGCRPAPRGPREGLPPCGQGPGPRRGLQGGRPRHARLPTASTPESTGSRLRRRSWFPAREEMGLWASFGFPGSPLPTVQTRLGHPESPRQSVLGAPGAGPVTLLPLHCGTGSRPLTGTSRSPPPGAHGLPGGS